MPAQGLKLPPFTYLHPHWFANPTWDSVRCIILTIGVYIYVRIGIVLVTNGRRMPKRQWYRFSALALLVTSVVYTEIIVMGSRVTLRLFLNFFALVYAAIGVSTRKRDLT